MTKNDQLRPSPASSGSPGMSASVQIRAEEYAAISGFLEARAGIRLGAGKEYLVASRLNRLIDEYALGGYAQLVRALDNLGDRRLQAAVVDAMTTNETFWFRDGAHYKALVDGVLAPRSPMRVRIWSAAVSTGQEAYSIAVSLREAMRLRVLPASMRYEILGTDISTRALAEARAARYCGVSASRGLSDEQRARYFVQQGDCFEVKPEYREGISLREFNLMNSFDALGRFDVIFCRNVLIYFSQERKRDIIERFARALQPGGYLFLGSTESMSDHTDLFEMRNVAGGLAYARRD